MAASLQAGAAAQASTPTPAETSPAEAQKALDLLATFPIPPKPNKPGGIYLPPGPFAGWSDADKAAVPRQVVQACMALFTMVHGRPTTHFLPPGTPFTDEVGLGFETCMATHMPSDWPKRPEVMASLNAIMARAAANGSPLRLPAAVKP